MSINDDLPRSKVQVSVIIPTLNRRDLIGHTLRSIHAQTFMNWEVIVIDDGSIDRTDEVVAEWSEKDDRIRYVKRQDIQLLSKGAPACRNIGTQLASGQYVIYVDSDDILARNALAQRVEVMDHNPGLDFAVFPCLIFRDDPGDIRMLLNPYKDTNDLDRFLALDPPWQTMSPIWRKSSIQAIGLWDELLLSWQDEDLHMRALICGLKYQHFPGPDCFWRVFQTDNIGSRANQPDYLINHTYLLEKIGTLLVENNLMTSERKDRLASLYFRLLDCLVRIDGYTNQAKAVWQTCYAHQLIEKEIYQSGLFYIRVMHRLRNIKFLKKIFGRTLKEYFKMTWRSPLLIPQESSSVMKTPFYGELPPLPMMGLSPYVARQETQIH